MANMDRRDFLRSYAMLGLGAGTGMLAGKAASREGGVFETSLAGFEKALLPREHGQLTSSLLPVRRRYPSREHCMQMAAFFGPNGGLLVYVKDSSTPPSEWTVSLGDRLQIEFFGKRPEFVVKRIERDRGRGCRGLSRVGDQAALGDGAASGAASDECNLRSVKSQHRYAAAAFRGPLWARAATGWSVVYAVAPVPV